MVHLMSNHNSFLSEGGALAGVVGDFPETPHRTRDNTDFQCLMRQSEARLRLAGPPPARRNGAPHERDAGGESDPFFGAGAPSERVSRFTSQFTVNPLLGGSLSPQRSLGKGHRTDEESEAVASTTGGVLCARKRRLRQRQPESGAGRYRCRHPTLHRRRPFRPSHTLGRRRSSVDEMHSSSMPPFCQIFPEGTLPYGCRPANQSSDLDLLLGPAGVIHRACCLETKRHSPMERRSIHNPCSSIGRSHSLAGIQFSMDQAR